MAHYRVGDRILSQEEYEEDGVHKWALLLFIIGALLAGSAMNSFLSEDWSKYIRFPVVILTGGFAGAVVAYFARPIRNLAGWAILLAILGGIGYGVWALM
jgi:hypothetical protein